MHITAQGPRLRNDLYCVQWDVKLYYTTILLLALVPILLVLQTYDNCADGHRSCSLVCGKSK